ncbi:ATP-binding protein [Yersinia enterocolitica]|uniref:ATP-dependent nuclease n=2 Tax=Yersinia TaxID=629 RepID=UPI0028B9F03C|nr:ATP-binding protein [Yersinia enterocolitica]EKN4058337.1 ATP-binding protein [Yersinia enterocolitica]EKN4887488.1 ATP-binding protein [Yersinia enterocolitica]EKN4891682.1 ATP-binding protein [Yersinia enterocolitica]EKN4904205.1 ATP-binding protein [Yersinia enterocolitica]
MDTINISISEVKNISSAEIEIPFEGGLYGFVGGNGCGKSTLMLILSVLLSERRYLMLKSEDYSDDSFINITVNSNTTTSNKWTPKNNKWVLPTGIKPFRYNGLYEGSLFYGARFDDSRVVDKLIRTGNISDEHVVDSVEYVKDNLSYILHGDHSHYRTLKKIKNRATANKLGLNNIPYFMEAKNGNLLSQYRMSSGECLLISLLNFIYYSVADNRSGQSGKALILIDEIELALHPIAITRLISLLNALQGMQKNVVIYLTSHSPEVIRSIKPSNMFMLSNTNGNINLTNPCFPSYAIRDVYRHDGFDYLILVEDKLAASVVDNVLVSNELKSSKLIHITPVGGWQNVLTLHNDLLNNNVIGINRKIISVLDGDVKTEVMEKDEFKNTPKCFLPIQSIEKLLYDVIFLRKNDALRKIINDKYFILRSLDELIAEHNERYKTTPENPDKKFYFRLKHELEKRNIQESLFIQNLCEDIKKVIDFSSFERSLTNLLNAK